LKQSDLAAHDEVVFEDQLVPCFDRLTLNIAIPSNEDVTVHSGRRGQSHFAGDRRVQDSRGGWNSSLYCHDNTLFPGP